MDIAITSINLKLNDGELTGANIYFNGKANTINMSGYIPLTATEYDGKTYDQLESIVIEKIVEKIKNPVE